MKLVWNYDSVIINFIADLVFFFIMVLIYKNNIKDGYFKFKEKYSLKPKVLFILKWVGVLLLINVIGGIITETFLPGLGIDDNTKMIIDLFDVSFIYLFYF